jgi:O-antigen/teichoic acid export membrane protein
VVAFAIGVNLYFSKLADFAVEWVGAREIIKRRDDIGPLVAAVMGTRLAFVCLLTVASILLVQLFMPEPDRSVLSLYLVTMIPLAASTKWVHLGLEDARPIGLARVLGETTGLVIVLAVMTQVVELWVPPVAQIASETMVAVFLFIALKQRGYQITLSLDLKIAIPVFRAGFPLVVHMLLGLFIYNSDLIFLRMFRDSEQVGYYAAAYTLISLVCNLGITYGMSLTPALTRLGPGSEAERAQYRTALAQVFAVTYPVSVGGCLLAGPIIYFAFGGQYTESVLALQVLIWSIPLSICRNVPWAALIARHREDLLLRAVVVGALVNVLLNVTLIPLYGMLGAAVATVITESMVGGIMLVYATRQGASPVEWHRLWKPLVAGTLMGLVLWMTGGMMLPLSIAVGVVVYGVCLATLGGVRFRTGELPGLNV